MQSIDLEYDLAKQLSVDCTAKMQSFEDHLDTLQPMDECLANMPSPVTFFIFPINFNSSETWRLTFGDVTKMLLDFLKFSSLLSNHWILVLDTCNYPMIAVLLFYNQSSDDSFVVASSLDECLNALLLI